MKKKIVSTTICMLVLAMIAPVSSAMNSMAEEIGNENTSDQNESTFIVGIMHVKFEKIGWGSTETITPVCVFMYGGPSGSRFLGPLTGTFEGGFYNFNGYVGPLYYVYQNRFEATYSDIGGLFFVCGRLP